MKKEFYLYNVKLRVPSTSADFDEIELDNMLFKEKMFSRQIFEYNSRIYEIMAINFNEMSVCDLTKNMRIGYKFNHDI